MKNNNTIIVTFEGMTKARTLNTLKDFANSAMVDSARFTAYRDTYGIATYDPQFYTTMERMTMIELHDGSYEVSYYMPNGLTITAKLERLHNSEQFDAITLIGIYLPALF